MYQETKVVSMKLFALLLTAIKKRDTLIVKQDHFKEFGYKINDSKARI